MEKIIYDLYKDNKYLGEDFCYSYQLEGTKEVYNKRGWRMVIKEEECLK